MPPDIQPFDLIRIFVGDEPWWFSLEIVARTAIMYLYTLLLIRALGSRTLGQLSLIEFLMVIGIGSAVGDPMLYADVPLLHGMVVVTVVVGLNRGVLFLINKNEQIERLIEGGPSLLVSRGLLHPERIEAANMNREKVFEMLRMHQVRHLGEIEAAFLEQSGQISLFRYAEDAIDAGLRVMPPWDLEEPTRSCAGDVAEPGTRLGCERCGTVVTARAAPLDTCPECEGTVWVDAICDDSGR